MNWDTMTPLQRDRLVAESVMGWKPDPCDEDKVTEYGSGDLYCPTCGVQGHISTFEHGEPKPRAYSQYIGVAWDIVEKMLARQEEEHYFKHFEWQGPQFKPSFQYLTNEGYPLGTTCWYVYLCVNGFCQYICAKTPQEAICKAVLKACDIAL